MNPPIFVTGIGTGVGKTVVSAVLSERLKADYWKPIQCGEIEHLDSEWVRSIISNSLTKIHPERYRLRDPLSPHAAAANQGLKLSLSDFSIPQTQNRLVIEGAGGLMVPLNSSILVIDLIKHFRAKVVLVSKNYLGSINHTLLSIEALKSRELDLVGVVFNGDPTPQSEEIIVSNTGVRVLGRIPWEPALTSAEISKYAKAMDIEQL